MSTEIIPTMPVRFNGLPSGLIPAGNNVIEVSLNTNRFATCRCATTSGVLYDDMTYQFSPTVGTSFYRVITGHQDDTTYHYYVRCMDTNGIKNDDDYDISFKLLPTPDSDSSILGKPGADGSGGAGAIPYGSPSL
ncbi:hypothetical protein EBR66_00725 [bacterium]|nr:hypothetical protein [bacterium]